jgi:arginase
MINCVFFIVASFLLISTSILAQSADGKLKVAIVKTAYSGLPSVWHEIDVGLELTEGPDILEREGLLTVLEREGCTVKTSAVELTPEEQQEFGVRHRLGIANGHLGRMVSAFIKQGYFPIGLQANDPSALGMLAGLQHSGPGRRPLKVGVVWIDAHADFNTPETSRSGMLGGMPVAIAAGLCLERLRRMSGLDPALPTQYIVLAGVLDTDPLEQELIDRSKIEMISAGDIKNVSANIHRQMKRLSRLTDAIYVHVDLVDIVDKKDRPGLELTFPEGPTSQEVSRALEHIFRYEKTAALGIASYPAGRDEDGMFLKAAYNIVEGAVKALRSRE